MGMITLELPEQQLVEWVRRLSPTTKQAILMELIPDLDRFELLVDYGAQQAALVAKKRGIDWNKLSEEEREALIDRWLHE